MTASHDTLQGAGWAGEGLYGVVSEAPTAPVLHQDGHMDWDSGGFIAMFIVMAVFWGGVLAIAAWAVAVYARKGGKREDSALDIARERYARGEITAEEFEQIKRGLS